MDVTLEDYADWFEDPDVEQATERELLLAVSEVEVFLRSALYTVAADGLPADPGQRARVVGAVCEQARAHALTRESHLRALGASPLGRPLQAASIDGVSWTASGESGLPSGYALSAPGSLCYVATQLLANFRRRIDLRA